MTGRVLGVGTRGSDLAVEQARRVLAGVEGEREIRIIRTSGDRLAEIPLGEQNPVGFFTKEIEDELLSGRIDLAVHSLKDLPVQLGPGLALAAMLQRDDPADILLVRPQAVAAAGAQAPGALAEGVLPLKQGATVGASSQRRSALLRHFRPDCSTLPIRGNVPTRVDKVRRGEFDAAILSRAGLERLRLKVDPLLAFELNPRRWPGAPGQAIIAVEARRDDAEALHRVSALNDRSTMTRADAERALLAVYGGGCHAPFGAYSEIGPAGAILVVAAPGREGPGREGGFHIARFERADCAAAAAEAEAWIRSGCAPRETPRGLDREEWLCRAARPWC